MPVSIQGHRLPNVIQQSDSFDDPYERYGYFSGQTPESAANSPWPQPNVMTTPFQGSIADAWKVLYPQGRWLDSPKHGSLFDHGPMNQAAWGMTNQNDTSIDPGLLAVLAIASGGLAMGALGGAGAAGAAGVGAADAAGLAAMGADAGLSGAALDAFVASGGTMGSTMAGGGGVGFGAGELFTGAGSGGGVGNSWMDSVKNLFSPSTSSGAGMSASAGITDATGLTGGAGGAGGMTGGTGGGMFDFMEMLKRMGMIPGSGGPMSTMMNLGSGLYGMYQSNEMKKLAEEAARMQDPFGPERGQYAGKLRNLYANPSSIVGMPGYQAGLDAVERKMASQGYLGSGNMMASLHQYGGDFFDKEVARLSGLAGAQFPPTGGNALLQGNMAGNNLASQSLATLGYGVRGLEGMFPGTFGW